MAAQLLIDGELAERARGVARRLEAGMVFLNRHNMAAAHPRGAFGGIKRSGYGRELGRWGLHAYSELLQIVDAPASS
jgi:acyl-CoA reductase-like NAD-dependent aldehyde dehydrogenase